MRVEELLLQDFIFNSCTDRKDCWCKKSNEILPPVVTGPMIILIGLSLAGSAVTNASQNWLLAIVALAIIIIANIWGKGMIKIIPILLGVVGSYVFALILNALGVKIQTDLLF